MVRIFVFFFCCVSVTLTKDVDGSSTKNPGYKVQITKKGMDYANELFRDRFPTLAEHVPVPDTEFDGDGMKGIIKNAKIDHFSAKNWEYSLIPPKRIKYAVSGGSFEGGADFDGSKTVMFFGEISASGNAKATSKDLSLDVTTEIGRDEKGRPTLKLVDCRFDLGKFKLKITGGGMARFASLLGSTLDNMVKGMVTQQVCERMKKIVNSQVKNLVANREPEVPITGDFSVDYTLTADPIVGPDFVQLEGLGDLLYRHLHATGLPLPPVDGSGADSSKMLNFWLTDHLFSSLAAQLHKSKMLKFEINTNILPSAAEALATTCVKGCVGSVVPEIGRKYPGAFSIVKIQSAAAPIMSVSSKEIFVAFKGVVNLGVEQNLEVISVGTANLSVNGTLLPAIQDDKIMGRVKIVNFDIVGTSSKLDDVIPWKPLFKLSEQFIEEEVNQWLKDGVALPVMGGLKIENPSLLLQNHSVEITADGKLSGWSGDDLVKLMDNLI